MKKFNQHILHKVNMEVNTRSEASAFRLKNDLDTFLKDDFLPQIEFLLDEIIPANQTLRYPSLDLEISLKPEDSLQMAREMLINQLRNKLDLIVPGSMEKFSKLGNKPEFSVKPGLTFLTEPLTDEEDALLYFLETGQLPWFVNPPEFSASLQNQSVTILIHNKVFIRKLKSLFAVKQDALERFVQQIKPELILELIYHLTGYRPIDKKILREKLSRLPPGIQTNLFKLIISHLILSNPSERKVYQMKFRREIPEKTSPENFKLIEEVLIMTGLPDGLFRETEQNNPITSGGKEQDDHLQALVNPENRESHSIVLKTLYLLNAGLILTHPFIPQLLATTGCLDEHKQLLPGKHQKMVQLLHYLATGNETDMEFNLTFEKYLCGLSLETTLTQLAEIDSADMQECDEVLRSMVRFWPALKNTSPDGLRQMFFHRNGKLDLHLSPHRLYIERKAQDVLLDKLQWNISIVKLPWMNDLLFVEW